MLWYVILKHLEVLPFFVLVNLSISSICSTIPVHVPCQFKEVVLHDALWDPEGNVFEHGRELAVGIELGNLSLLELGVELLVLRPE